MLSYTSHPRPAPGFCLGTVTFPSGCSWHQHHGIDSPEKIEKLLRGCKETDGIVLCHISMAWEMLCLVLTWSWTLGTLHGPGGLSSCWPIPLFSHLHAACKASFPQTNLSCTPQHEGFPKQGKQLPGRYFCMHIITSEFIYPAWQVHQPFPKTPSPCKSLLHQQKLGQSCLRSSRMRFPNPFPMHNHSPLHWALKQALLLLLSTTTFLSLQILRAVLTKVDLFLRVLCPIVTASSGTPEVLPSASCHPSYLSQDSL